MTEPEFVEALEAAGLLQDEYPEQMAASSCTCTGAVGDTICGAHRLMERYEALWAAFHNSNNEKREQRKRAMAAEGTVEQARRERDAAWAALWTIRMEAERSTVDEPPGQLPSVIIHLALGALGANKQRAQELAAAVRRAQTTTEADHD